MEWIRADREGEDSARSWVEAWLEKAAGEQTGESALKTLRRTLPSRVFRVLTERPPYMPWWVTGSAALLAINAQSPEASAAVEQVRRRSRSKRSPEVVVWQSPTASILKLRDVESPDVEEGGGR